MTESSRTKSLLRIVLVMAASQTISYASAIPPKYFIAGDYSTKSRFARAASLIDLDQLEIERLLSLDLQNKDSNWQEKAMEVYEKGMHAGVFAQLMLRPAIDRPVALTKPVESVYDGNSITFDRQHHDVYELNVLGGNDSYDTPINGIVRTEDADNFMVGTVKLTVFYPEESKCLAHGSIEDCFAGPEGGIILQGYGAIDYTYNPRTSNKFQYSLKGYSESEGMRMVYCELHRNSKHCSSYEEYHRFFDYYGLLDYGNEWITSAFNKQSTQHNTKLKLAHGSVDFSKFSDRSRNAAITTATVSMNVFTMVNRLLVEFGMDGCAKSATDFSSYGSSSGMDSVIASWDQAFATYTGSAMMIFDDHVYREVEENESPTGSLYYHMVQGLAEDFGVLEESGKTDINGGRQYQSILNRKIMEAFAEGKQMLTEANCYEVRHQYFSILHGMRVPWIQGVLRATYVLSSSSGTPAFREEERGRGAAFLAALLPDLHSCNPTDAKTIYDELSAVTSSGKKPDYNVVRAALEHHYDCLGVTCDDVGGYLSPDTGGYYKDTHPCGGFGSLISHRRESVAFQKPSSKSFVGNQKSGLAGSTFFVAMALFCASLAVLIVAVRDRAHGRPVDIRSTARRLAGGAVSQVDYFLSRDRSHDGYSEASYNDGYDVQLRSISMASQSPLQPSTFDDESIVL